jgi:hypothetical protein
MRMRGKEFLHELFDNPNQLFDNHKLLDGLVRRFILMCRHDVAAMAAGALGT